MNDAESQISLITDNHDSLKKNSIVNEKLVTQFQQLTCFNQTIGDEIANFDIKICDLEHQVQMKIETLQKIASSRYKINKSIIELRKELLKNTEFKMSAKNLINNQSKNLMLQQKIETFRSIITDENDPTQSTSLLVDKIQLLKESNEDLETKIRIIKMLLNKKYKKSKEKYKLISDEIDKKNNEIDILDDEIAEYQIRNGLGHHRKNNINNTQDTSLLTDVENDALELFGYIRDSSEDMNPSETITSCIVYSASNDSPHSPSDHSKDNNETKKTEIEKEDERKPVSIFHFFIKSWPEGPKLSS